MVSFLLPGGTGRVFKRVPDKASHVPKRALRGAARLVLERRSPPLADEKKAKENPMPRKYGQKASEKVERAMHEMKRGELKSGGSGKTVHDRKQALAIGLSEARQAGGKVPRTGASRSSKSSRSSRSSGASS
jgi:hypothetical protein